MIEFKNIFELMEMIARYGLLPLVLIESMLIAIVVKKGYDHEIAIISGLIPFHVKHGLLKTTCIKALVAVLISYPVVIFSRLALFLIYSVHVIVFAYRLLSNNPNHKNVKN